MARYYLGVDTGATKTHALITDRAGEVKAFVSAGPGNPQSIGGYAALEKLLASITQSACREAGISINQISAAGLGLAGFDWPSQKERFYLAARIAGLPEQTALVNDAGLGIYSGTTEGWGICVAAGTSFNCRGRGADGKEAFAIGDGAGWGEGAGALELATQAAQAVIAQYTMRGPQTRLTELFMLSFNAPNLAELAEGIVRGKYRVSAELAPQVITLAHNGDHAAKEAVLWAAQRLADLTKGAIRQLGAQNQAVEVVLSGSFFKAGELLIAPMQADVVLLAPHASFHMLDIPPVCGGVLLAMETDGGLDSEERKAVKAALKSGLG